MKISRKYLLLLAIAIPASLQGSANPTTHPVTDAASPNAAYPLQMTNYLGNIENIHPKVLYFENGWRGHRFWMAYTPYPLGATEAENPCVAVSDDGYVWKTPDGLVNPLCGTPEHGYNSDTHLLYNPATDHLEVWWRPVDTSGAGIRDAFMRSISRDGVTWSAPLTALDYGEPDKCRLSPAVSIVRGRYYMVYSNCYQLLSMWGDPGREGDIVWEEPRLLHVSSTDRHLSFWHHDFIVDSDGNVEMVVCAFSPREGGSSNAADLYYVTYNIDDPDNISVPEMIIGRTADPAAIDSRSIYRSSIVRTGDGYMIYYSCIDNAWHRYMSVSRGTDIHHLHGIDDTHGVHLDEASVDDIAGPALLSPGVPFDVTALVRNHGLRPIGTLDISLTCGDGISVTRHIVCEPPLAPRDSMFLTVPAPAYDSEYMQMPVTVAVTGVNGSPNGYADNTGTLIADCSDNITRRRVIIETNSATWHGGTPQLITAMHELEEARPGSFIGIDIHTDDELYCDSYATMPAFFDDCPQALVQRRLLTDSDAAALSAACDALAAPAYIDVRAGARFKDRLKRAVVASATVSFDKGYDDIDYRIAFVITEDRVQAIQTNGYAGGGNGVMGGFETLPADAPVLLDNVARYVSDWQGDAASAITSASAGDTVYYERTIPLDDCMDFDNRHNLSVVAMLIDNMTENREPYTGDRTTVGDPVITGVSSTEAGSGAVRTEYYSPQGIRVDRPAPGGLYILRRGTEVSKTIL